MANNNIHWKGGSFDQNYQAKTYNPASYSTQLVSGDLFNDTIQGKSDKYQIDLLGSMMTWNVSATPLLTLLYNMATESAPPSVITWADEYKGESWFDIKLDNVRLMDTHATATSGTTFALPGSGYGSSVTKKMHAVTSSDYVGGRFEFKAGVLSNNNIVLAEVDDDELINVAVKDSDGYYKIIIPESTSYQGKAYEIYNSIRQYVMNLGYTNAGETATLFTFDASSTSSPVYFAWDEVHFAKIGNKSVETASFHEVLMRLEKVDYATIDSVASVVLTLNPAMSNESLSSYTHMLTFIADDDQVLQEEVSDTADEVTAGQAFGGMISRPSRMMQIGQNTVAPQGIPEGDIFRPSGNITTSRESRDNLSQIFASPKYGITGTHAASKFRFGDDFANTRAFYLEEYKKSKVAAYLTGVKGETFAVNDLNTIASNQPVRTLGGMLDYALFPITYMKKPFENLRNRNGFDDDVSSVKVALKLGDWFDSLADSLFAFRSNGSENLTLLASRKFLGKLDLYVRSVMNDPFLGGRVMIQKPSQITYGLEIYTFQTSKGHNITFVHEPALDYMVQFPVAYHIFGRGHVDAKDILLSIDTANIKQVICRPDKLEGGIQDIGQDAFLEAMRGESSFLLRNPKNHAVVWAPDEA